MRDPWGLNVALDISPSCPVNTLVQAPIAYNQSQRGMRHTHKYTPRQHTGHGVVHPGIPVRTRRDELGAGGVEAHIQYLVAVPLQGVYAGPGLDVPHLYPAQYSYIHNNLHCSRILLTLQVRSMDPDMHTSEA